MLQDILNTSHDVIVEGKKYQFEFDHSAYAAFEQQSHKSIFEIYDRLLATNNISYMESLMIVSAGLLKYHCTQEICDFQSARYLEHHKRTGYGSFYCTAFTA